LNSAINLIVSLPEKILSPITELTAAQKQKYSTDARRSLPQHFREFYKKMTDHRAKNYTAPIRQAIASLSLSDLSAVAETFLGASQIQKRVNPDLETVGGPVDVAVISKGDGFVWVKRKHYFEERINPSFRMRYLEQ
jgi:ribosomal protein L3